MDLKGMSTQQARYHARLSALGQCKWYITVLVSQPWFIFCMAVNRVVYLSAKTNRRLFICQLKNQHSLFSFHTWLYSPVGYRPIFYLFIYFFFVMRSKQGIPASYALGWKKKKSFVVWLHTIPVLFSIYVFFKVTKTLATIFAGTRCVHEELSGFFTNMLVPLHLNTSSGANNKRIAPSQISVRTIGLFPEGIINCARLIYSLVPEVDTFIVNAHLSMQFKSFRGKKSCSEILETFKLEGWYWQPSI